MLPRSVARAAGEKRYRDLMKRKQEAFENRYSTSHWPVLCELLCKKKKKEGALVGKPRFNVSDSAIGQPDPTQDLIVASLAGMREEPALLYTGEPLLAMGFPELIFRLMK